jgi:hypothetical protein
VAHPGSSLLKAVVAAWLVAVGIGAITIGVLTFLKQDGVAAADERPQTHWSVRRMQGSWSDEDPADRLFVPVVPRLEINEISDAAI